MTVIYRNYFSNFVIPKEKAELLDEYKVCYIDEATGSLKRIYTVLDGRVDWVEYYLEPGENETEITKLYGEELVCFILRGEQIEDFVVEHHRYYRDNKLSSVSDVVCDIYGNTICAQELDSATLEPLFKETSKYFYRYDEYDEEWGSPRIIKAGYKKDGSLDYLLYSPTPENEQNDERYDSGSFKALQAQFSEDLSYYLTARLLP